MTAASEPRAAGGSAAARFRSGGKTTALTGDAARSRRAILATGLSARYFDEHFRLVRAVDRPGDRRVTWRYRIGGYETTVDDAIGFTTESGRRTPVHGITAKLGTTREIVKTIARASARDALRACLGKYRGESVVFTTVGSDRRATLYLTGHTAPDRDEKEREREREKEKERERERERRDRVAAPPPAAHPQGTPPPPRRRPNEEDEEGERRPIYIGYVDLETGKCTKVAAMATP
jgi:hypothetical protein